MRDKLLELEQLARQLEPSPLQRDEVRQHVISYSENFLNNIESLKAYETSAGKGEGLLDSPISEEGIGIDAAIELVRTNVDTPGLNPASGGHLAYIPGGGIYYSALGDYLADVFNRYAGVFYASPGAVRMENMLIRWMCDLVGYPAEAGGNLTTSGSLANMIAVVTARDGRNMTNTQLEKLAIASFHRQGDPRCRVGRMHYPIYRSG